MIDFNKQLGPNVLGGVPELHHDRRRSLESNSNDNSFQSLLVDGQGNEYEPYSLAWRYLGLYKDCADDHDDDGDDDSYNNNGGSSQHSGSGDENEDCQRKLLWAAYVDPHYSGNAIEEYQYYDLTTRTWDDSACKASGSKHRCARMDCHEPFTHFKLVGIFKETEGMYDFTEQLFKHEGYCVWQGGSDNDNDEGSGSRDSDDTYETMETWMETWPADCKKLDEKDNYGNSLYMAMEPQAEGNMTLAIYTDSKCMTIAEYIDYESYIVQHYVNMYEAYSYWYGYDYGYNLGVEAASEYSQAIDLWNEKMSTFKVCQPCKSYNLFAENNDGNSGSNDHRFLGGHQDHRGRRRFLGGDDENDGDGEEQERFNCYDDAGYTNVNQCYKFETHTSLEAASNSDLKKASAQGSILWIRSNWKVYGKGGYASPMAGKALAGFIGLAALAAVGFVGFAFCVSRHLQRKRSSKELESTESESTCDANSCTGSATDASSAATTNPVEKEGIETNTFFGAVLARSKFYLRRHGFLESRQRRAMPSSLKDTFYVENDYGAFAGKKYAVDPSSANEVPKTRDSLDKGKDEAGAAENDIDGRGTIEMETNPSTRPNLPTTEDFQQQYQLLDDPPAVADETCNTSGNPGKSRAETRAAENDTSGAGMIEMGGIKPPTSSHADTVDPEIPRLV